MNEVIQKTGLGTANIPNTSCITATAVDEAITLLPDVVEHAKGYLGEFFNEYQSRMNPLIDEEIDKLASLEEKHKDYPKHHLPCIFLLRTWFLIRYPVK